ncbi:MAG: DUF5050 domain-containing protein [Clostridium sp.]|nr:DUF5050 domain-containing protein [Clostridium sp.]
MKKLILIPLFCCIFLMGCNKSNDTPKDSSSSNNSDTVKSNSYSNTKVTLPSNSINYNKNTQNLNFITSDSSYSKFISIGQLLFFSDSNNNNKLSVTNSSLPANYIEDKNIQDIYDYSVESMTSIDNIIYFTNISENYSLYKLDYEKNLITLVSSNSFTQISSSQNDIIYLNKSIGNTLNCYNTKNNTSIHLSSDKCGSFIVNGEYILYQNLDDNSSLYIIKKDGTERRKLTSTGVDSFATFKNHIIYINATDNYLYSLDLSSEKSNRIDLLNGTNLKYYNEKFYFINLENSNHLYSFSIDDELNVTGKTPFINNSINNYYLTEHGVFSEQGIDINKIHFKAYE